LRRDVVQDDMRDLGRLYELELLWSADLRFEEGAQRSVFGRGAVHNWNLRRPVLHNSVHMSPAEPGEHFEKRGV
jgi:hypothetical protein